MKGLTERQREVLDFIKRYKAENGISPTYGEIADYFRKSNTTMRFIVERIRKKGFLMLTPGKARTIIILY